MSCNSWGQKRCYCCGHQLYSYLLRNPVPRYLSYCVMASSNTWKLPKSLNWKWSGGESEKTCFDVSLQQFPQSPDNSGWLCDSMAGKSCSHGPKVLDLSEHLTEEHPAEGQQPKTPMKDREELKFDVILNWKETIESWKALPLGWSLCRKGKLRKKPRVKSSR